ncbi:flagellar basal-body rod protein FlgF [Denitrobaculum tricleocarpae]|uniref:Flagellar basal-body rod protein FlgF n=1 Tax=Denitrobaculum tricleocarpae TaxID=2591009 RepID=A0A545T253_9PROT|nr:flagellar basal-body rod protein FlgF [Denitrobaculum tricleocarpae]TQV71275.1 flagellar basal-body rod protein FlgF [Denitrobaculum tricleocarpae]
MENTGYIALSRQSVLRRQMDIIANNMANMTTPAFKGEDMMFVEHLKKTANNDRVSLVQDLALLRNLNAGPMTKTDNPLDLAINGDGYFVVETPDGERYTRNGTFQLNQDGQIVTTQGDPVLGIDGNAITIPPNEPHISITRDGSISAGETLIGRIQIVGFENEQELEKQSNSLFARGEQEPQVAEGAEVAQGMIEGSNVQGIVEMTKMITTVRSYSSTSKLVDQEHERQRRAIQVLASSQQ